MISGIVNVYKEKGFTSHDVVAKLRGILHQKKIGHTGTLDPDAVGVLPVCLGRATKLCDMLTDQTKTYETVLLLGQVTDTQDISGMILEESKVTVNPQEVIEAILKYLGDYDQIPPMYSALKVGGKKLYQLAREGIGVERKPRRVQILDIQILKMDLPRVTMSVTCSKGTYIRTLCHDIGADLGCGGCMESLIRTQVGNFSIENSLTLKEIEEKVIKDTFLNDIMSIPDMFTHLPKVVVKRKYHKLIYNGNPFYVEHCIDETEHACQDGQVRVYDEDETFIGIFKRDDSLYVPVKMFLEP